MTDIVVTATVNGVPTNGLADPPEIEIIRSDTGAVVQAFVAMTDLLVSGKYAFAFVPTVTLDYAFTVDTDPNATSQVEASERFFDGAFPGNIDILADTGDLVNLDVAVSSRAQQSDILSDATPFPGARIDATISSRATQSSVDAIQNNTRFAGIVPAALILPVSGSTTYRLFGRLFDTAGNPEDPDSNNIDIRIEDSAGGVVVATVAMTRTGVGLYQFDYVVNSTDTERQLNVFFEYDENAISFQHVRTTVVTEWESTLDEVRQATVVDIPASIAALNDLDIADVQTALTNQGYTAARALLLDNLDGTISSVITAISGLNDISVADILGTILTSGNTVDAELSAILLLRDFIEGGRDIDFVGNDVLGWQRIERNVAGTLIRRYNLFDETGSRINETVASFLARQGMISSEVAI